MNAPTVVESNNGPKLPDNNYEIMLRESIDHFLAEYTRGCTDFSGFGSIFFRLVQTMADPPIEIVWFYAAVTFHGSVKSMIEDSKKVVVAAKYLFQLLVSCSSPCNGLKRVAVLAPVVCELYYAAFDCLNERDLCLKGEIEGLVEGVVSYISICCSNYPGEQWDVALGNLTARFKDLIRVWTVDRVGENCEFDDLRVFFPLVSSEVCSGVSVGCGANYLAGIVMVEAFLLRLCLKFGSRVSREELQKDMQNWAVQTIEGFQNCFFFDMLLKMLLEPTLPVTTLLCSEDEVLLKEVLYDIVMLVEYSFLKSQMWTWLPGNYLKNFALTWLLVADSALQFVRESHDHTRAISYIDAFSKSCLPNQLIKWVIDQTALEEKSSIPNVSTPKALIRWLLVLEDHGVQVFDHNVLKLHAKALICKPKVDNEISGSNPSCESPNGGIFSCIENNEREENKVDEDQEMVDQLDDAFAPADCMVHSVIAERRKKRKEGRTDDGVARFKLAKFCYGEDAVGEICLPCCDDNLNSAKEVEIHSMV